MIENVLSDAEERMRKAIEALGRELAAIRTGRASPSLVENIKVDYYGASTPINQLAALSAPEARTILIQPWDRGAISSIEKAILKSDLGLNPVSDGVVIRLPIPELTEERRRELVKVVRRRMEESKVEIRNIRREALEELRGLEKQREISEDEQKRASGLLQRLTDSFMADVEGIGQGKETELLES